MMGEVLVSCSETQVIGVIVECCKKPSTSCFILAISIASSCTDSSDTHLSCL